MAEVAELPPGRALDLGCGHGGDAIWLAQRGWTVTAIDVSAAALAVAEEDARAAGVEAPISWQLRDIADGLPAGPFELVAATYLHSPVELPREPILREAASIVAPGGTLVVIGHAPSSEHPDHDLPSEREVLDGLAPATAGWEVVTCTQRRLQHAFPGQEPRERIDSIVRLRRPDGD